MKAFIKLLTIIVVTSNSFCQEENPDKLLEQIVSESKVVGVSAGYSINGETLWQAANGYAYKEKKQQFLKETKVRMASIAKPMTALAVMQLVEQNLIDLDAPIQAYIPDYPKQPNTQITTRHLLSHTSGIGGYKNGKEAQTKVNYPRLSDAIEFFKNRPLLFEPGTQYGYTTYGYTLLGVIIEKASGITYETYMQKHIWDKANMTNTGIEIFGNNKENGSGLYHKNKKGKIKEGKENNLSNRIPGGGFYTTVGDMLKFGNAVINNTFVKPETLSLMREHHSLEKERNAYGFGWFLYNPKPNEGAIIGHSGGQTGCSSQLYIVPEKGIVTIVLANTSGASKEATIFASQLLKIALDTL
ncbi:serine hydrolase domain-containing protein [Aquimarina rubra]|uniref:Serine hydrolase domain-containing protein n=1 Tax=Aquimarina rubra TaxID=1920033 RepID=A0ABW5LFF1_9FLAO